jgi:glycosyltransferase involved in cell wall biosynthesis
VVGIALLTLVPGALGGSESATRGLLRSLARDGTLPYRVYLPPVEPDGGEGLPSTIVTGYRRARTMPERVAAMGQATLRPRPLRRTLAAASVVHYPLTLRIPTVRQPSVVTLYDLQHLDLPQLFSRSERAFRTFAYHRSVRGADRVICSSTFVAQRAIAQLELDANRVRVIPLGVDRERLSPGSEARERFLLYPARRWPHKNHARLFDAFALLRRNHPELTLVLTGGGEYGTLPPGVEARGLVYEAELLSLYRRAAAVVFPSFYEGFGQPPLEAMACGCPVACSDAASLPEVCGDAAAYFDPSDPEAIAAAVERVLADPERWTRLGLARAASLTWESCAAAHEAVYRELL